MVHALEITTLEYGPERLPIPVRSTRKQVKLAKLMLERDLDEDSWTQLLEEAGYSANTARKQARQIREGLGVVHATQAIMKSQRDSSRALEVAARGKILGRIDDDTASDALLVATYKTAAELRMAGADDRDETAQHDLGAFRSWRKKRLKRAIHLALVMFARPQQVVLSPVVDDSSTR